MCTSDASKMRMFKYFLKIRNRRLLHIIFDLAQPSAIRTNPGGGSAFGVVRNVRTLYEALTRRSLPEFELLIYI